MPTNKEIMKNWQLPKNAGYGRISEALNDARFDEQVKLRRLVALWERIIELDDKRWDSSNWEKYSKEWNKIKNMAKIEIKRLKKAKL